MIKPTVGRVVWYYPYGATQVKAKEQPSAAIIAHVWSESVVNLGYFDANGVAHGVTSVPLVQSGEEGPEMGFCCWMPYQQGQAAKAEELEKKLREKGGE